MKFSFKSEIQIDLEKKLARIAKVGKAFLIGQGIVYPIQHGFLKVKGPLRSPEIKKIKIKKLSKRLK
ncbi:hypothetical protein A9Q84_09685 [Halobacteriovorax marinus]|uniref:Uncharacterized protein n=1 Tax=Halobacteriovorax marinus TaxID=97084 RepID=A0A1Y5F6T7_9BACT|nr:hypothetical protein A9Q84_09685 [Halobacteriovorax marinus]